MQFFKGHSLIIFLRLFIFFFSYFDRHFTLLPLNLLFFIYLSVYTFFYLISVTLFLLSFLYSDFHYTVLIGTFPSVGSKSCIEASHCWFEWLHWSFTRRVHSLTRSFTSFTYRFTRFVIHQLLIHWKEAFTLELRERKETKVRKRVLYCRKKRLVLY